MEFSFVRQFLDLAADFQAKDEREDVFRELAELQGFENLTFCSFAVDSEALHERDLVTTYSRDWSELYLDQRFERIDPLILAGRRRRGLIDWSTLKLGSSKEKNFMELAATYGIAGPGLSLSVQRAGGEIGLLSIQFRYEEPEAILRNPNSIVELASLAQHISSKMEPAKTSPKSSDNQFLTAREKEALCWAARGKSCWETGAILGLSERTVGSYLHNAMGKLGATSKTHAVVLSLRRGLITLDECGLPDLRTKKPLQRNGLDSF